MIKNIAIILLAIACGGMLYHLTHASTKPNNHYDLLIYQDYFELKDGQRTVNRLQWEANPQLDSVIKADNL